MKIYTNKRLPSNASNYDKIEYFVHKLLGRGLWIKLVDRHNNFYFYQFEDIIDNWVYCKTLDIDEDTGEVYSESYRTTFDILNKCYRVWEPVQVLTDEEFNELYMNGNPFSGE